MTISYGCVRSLEEDWEFVHDIAKEADRRMYALSLIHISKVITKEVTNIADTLETQTSEIKQINEGIEQINDVVQDVYKRQHGAGQSRIHLTCICQIDNQILLCSRFFWDSPVDPHDMITVLCKMSCNMGTK